VSVPAASREGTSLTLRVVGLGPESERTAGTALSALVRDGTTVIMRTRHHAAAAEFAGAGRLYDCDDIAPGPGADEAIAARVLTAASESDVIFAVPGTPFSDGDSVMHVVRQAARRAIETTILPTAGALVARGADDEPGTLEELVGVVARLHAPDGCPWDREQTHESLRHHLLEESYECLEAIDSGDRDAIIEELGDVLLQVLMHAAVGERGGSFTLDDVAEHISQKLISRHPHVFGSADVGSAEEAWRNWDVLKRREKPARSILEGVPASLPALAASQAIQSRARRAGFDWPDVDGPLEKLREEIGELAQAENAAERDDEFGDVLFVITNIADHLGIDAEQALRGANRKFRLRFTEVERLVLERGFDLSELDIAALDGLWDEAKETLSG